MRVGTVCLGATLLQAGPLHAGDHAGDKTDVLYMNNGDRLTCEIKSLDAGALYIGLDYVDGTITVNWSKVRRLESKRLFIVRLESGLVYTGTLAVVDSTVGEEQEQFMELTDLEGHRITLDKEDVVTMGKTSGSFLRRFVVDLSGGLTYAKGNEATQYNINTMIQYPRERWGLIANLNSTLQSSAGVTASTRNQLTLNGYHLLPWKNYFVGGTGALLQSTEQGISPAGVRGRGHRLLPAQHRACPPVAAWRVRLPEHQLQPGRLIRRGVRGPGRGPPRRQPERGDLQQDQPAHQREHDAGAVRARPLLLHDQCHLLPQVVEQSEVQPVPLWQRRHQATGGAVGERLRLQFRAGVDVREQAAAVAR
jgi:hypothetical protein